MQDLVQIENIEEMRRQAGINDVKLREQIHGLAVGDLVRLTLLTGASRSAGETLPVRVTRIRGRTFRGKLVANPGSAGLVKLQIGSSVAFTTAHIHSVPSDRQDGVPTRRRPTASPPRPSFSGTARKGASMAAKNRTSTRPVVPFPPESLARLSLPPLTTTERFREIESLRELINSHVEFLCRVGSLSGTSLEAKEKAVVALHECMAVLEGELARIQEELQLG